MARYTLSMFITQGRLARQNGVPLEDCPWPEESTGIAKQYRIRWIAGWKRRSRDLTRCQGALRYAARALVLRHPSRAVDDIGSSR